MISKDRSDQNLFSSILRSGFLGVTNWRRFFNLTRTLWSKPYCRRLIIKEIWHINGIPNFVARIVFRNSYIQKVPWCINNLRRSSEYPKNRKNKPKKSKNWIKSRPRPKKTRFFSTREPRPRFSSNPICQPSISFHVQTRRRNACWQDMLQPTTNRQKRRLQIACACCRHAIRQFRQAKNGIGTLLDATPARIRRHLVHRVIFLKYFFIIKRLEFL